MIKLSWNKFNQAVYDLYTKNYEMLLTEIKNDLRKENDNHVHIFKDLTLLRRQCSAMHFSTIPIKITTTFFEEINKLILKSYDIARNLDQLKQSFKRKTKLGNLSFPISELLRICIIQNNVILA